MRTRLTGAAAIGAIVLSTFPLSITWSGGGPLVTESKAFAVVGRPATPGSVAGVNRRHDRRQVRRCAAGVTCPHY